MSGAWQGKSVLICCAAGARLDVFPEGLEQRLRPTELADPGGVKGLLHLIFFSG